MSAGDLCGRVSQIYERLYYKSFDTFSVSRLDELFSRFFSCKLLSLYAHVCLMTLVVKVSVAVAVSRRPTTNEPSRQPTNWLSALK